jgi:uncharacterized membrane protein YgcG
LGAATGIPLVTVALGGVDSRPRANLYDNVISPIYNLGLQVNVPMEPPPPRPAWMAQGSVPNNVLLEWYKATRRNAQAIGDAFALSLGPFSSFMDSYSKALGVVSQLQAATAQATGAQPGVGGSSMGPLQPAPTWSDLPGVGGAPTWTMVTGTPTGGNGSTGSGSDGNGSTGSGSGGNGSTGSGSGSKWLLLLGLLLLKARKK